MATLKRISPIGRGVILLTAVAVLIVWINGRSDDLLRARHPLSLSKVHASVTPEAIAEGVHLTTIAACAACHGDGLRGHMQTVAGTAVFAPNLTIETGRLSDAQVDRAIRRGLRPDGTSELAMPAQVYAGFSDDEIGAIIGYLRSLPPQGASPSQPPPNFLMRTYLAFGAYQTVVQRLEHAKFPIEASPTTERGRHLAAIACGQCHGGDLGGGQGAPGPDLTVRGYYDRPQFHTLLETGEGVGPGSMELMGRVARMSFSHFSAAEVDAIYDYLDARDNILSGDAARHKGR